ncbi:hypothetical protein B7494_g7177 [Chlorociboria aeruginascens]|nr:hypothetical protein B7494_g7177 [Chlorociboria aeruginascens]
MVRDSSVEREIKFEGDAVEIEASLSNMLSSGFPQPLKSAMLIEARYLMWRKAFHLVDTDAAAKIILYGNAKP